MIATRDQGGKEVAPGPFVRGAMAARAHKRGPTSLSGREVLWSGLREQGFCGGQGFGDFCGVLATAAGGVGFSAAFASDNRGHGLNDFAGLDFGDMGRADTRGEGNGVVGGAC